MSNRLISDEAKCNNGLKYLLSSILSGEDCYSCVDLKAMFVAYSIPITIPI